MAARAQVGVEFFLVAAFLFALAVVFFSSGEAQLRDAESLQKAALAKAAVDSLAAMVDYVYLSGVNTQVNQEVFVPQGSVCFLFNSTFSPATIQCEADPSISGRVSSRGLRTSSVIFSASCPPYSQERGWFRITVRNNNSVSITCTKI